MIHRRRGLVALLVLMAALLCVELVPLEDVNAAGPSRASLPNQKPSDAADGYVGSAKCASCHDDIYESYANTKMGRSLALVTPALISTLALPAQVDSRKLDRHYAIFSKDGKLYQSEWQSGTDGKDIFRETREMKWIIGAGTNGFGALLQRGDFLFEAPLSFYTRSQTWELSPGYETQDIAFNRPVQADCIFCHSGRPRPADAISGKFEATPFNQLGIGCENCHGPGAAHIAAMHTHHAGATNPQIVNPRNMSAALENELCMSCHEGGDARVPQPGKTYADFRPGSQLNETLAIFMKPMRPGNTEDSEHVQHYLQMSMSKCYRASLEKISGAQMSCTTCHDPHIEPTHEQAPAYFNAKCMVCHQSHGCALPVAARKATTPADNCIACHMPRRGSTESAHTTLANHRILARPDEPWPDVAFQQTTPGLPDLVHVNRTADDYLPTVTLLAAYDKIMQSEPEYTQAYLSALDRAEQSDPENADVQRALGFRDINLGKPDTAIVHLRHSIATAPKVALTYVYLSEALKRNRQIGDATLAIEKAVELNPYSQQSQRALVGCLLQNGQPKDAEAAAQHYIDTFAEDQRMGKVLEQIRKSQ